MARKTGLNRESLENLALDAGIIYANYGTTEQKILGATRGGNTWVLESENRDMPFDGITGIARGGRRVLGVTPKLTANFITVTRELLRMAVPGSEWEDIGAATDETGAVIAGETYYELTRKLTKTIPDFEYNDICYVGELSGTKAPIICGVKSAITEGGINLSFTDADEAVLTIEFTGTIDPENPDDEPWFVRRAEVDV